MTPLEIFLWGAGGSASIEVVSIYQIFETEKKLPPKYSSFVYWLVRLLLAVIAGGLALAYDIDTPLLAANIGAATPLILQALSKGIRGG
jgi:hypothetical protein